MATNLGRLQHTLSALRAEAVLISGHDHEGSDLATLLKDAGGTVETFLKAHVFPGNHGNFYALINHLATVGVGAADIGALHTLRTRYNQAKHDPAYSPTFEDVTGALSGAINAVSGWRGRGLGTSEVIAVAQYRRVVWIVGWDHYAHGDGEIHIFTPVDPAECDFPLSIDTIYLKGLAFPAVLTGLGGAVRPAKGLIPDKFIDRWENEGDCAGAYVFEGSYRDLLRQLAGAEMVLDLIASLKRENDASAMRTAVSFAAIDAIRDPATPNAAEDLVNAILLQALTDYAAPSRSELPKRYAREFAELIVRVPDYVQRRLAGPRFVSPAKFRELRTTALAAKEAALICHMDELVLLLGNL